MKKAAKKADAERKKEKELEEENGFDLDKDDLTSKPKKYANKWDKIIAEDEAEDARNASIQAQNEAQHTVVPVQPEVDVSDWPEEGFSPDQFFKRHQEKMKSMKPPETPPPGTEGMTMEQQHALGKLNEQMPGLNVGSRYAEMIKGMSPEEIARMSDY
eukprot:FR744369.1.p1 GENE.FR744369.1~~FR744369.1.p1  ORF type:complete len:178 (+),score=46.25 FR744369.1:62-535(+)